jgi:hypothetical protein
MSPSTNAAFVRKCVVPVPNFMDISPGGQAGASGNANRTIRVGVVKTDAAGCKRVQVGGLNLLMTVTTGNITVVLIGQNEQEICRFHATTGPDFLG